MGIVVGIIKDSFDLNFSAFFKPHRLFKEIDLLPVVVLIIDTNCFKSFSTGRSYVHDKLFANKVHMRIDRMH